MTHTLTSSHTEKLGVAYVSSICAKARVIFRTISVDDVGIDGFIELVEDGIATGILAGVQIKSGESFIDNKGQRFKLIADQDHFGYWARCSFPVIGIIYSPKYEKAVWLNLTELATDKRIIEGPFTVSIRLTSEAEFTPANLLSHIAPIIHKFSYQRRTLWQIQELLRPKQKSATLETPSLETSTDRDEAWLELIKTFFSESSSNEEIADAGYRLSWYFPSVSSRLRSAFKRELKKLNDFQLLRILEVIHILMEQSADSAAELIVDLLSYKPNICSRIENLLKKRKIPLMLREAAVQVIEVINQGFDEELREEVGAS